MIPENGTPNPEEKVNKGAEETPQTPPVPEEGTEGEATPPSNNPPGEGSPPKEEDYKEKFGQSTQENQRILGESKLKDDRIAELETKLSDKEDSEPPSEAELKAKYPDWEDREEEEKERLRKEEAREKRLRVLEEAKAWKEDFENVLGKYPELEKVKAKFKAYAYKYPKSVDLTTLAKAFLHDNKIESDPETPPSPPEPEKPGLETPTGGKPIIPDKMTLKDIKRLRETNFKEYLRLVNSGKIKDIPKE